MKKSKQENIIGQKINQWLVLEKDKNAKWKCICDCGNIGYIRYKDLLLDRSKRCVECGIKIMHKSRFVNLKGEKIGKWTVLEIYNRSKNGMIIWECVCDCGNKGLVQSGNLLGGVSRKCRSCNYKNIKISLWNRIIHSAKKRNIPFNITIEEANEIFENQDGRCALSGVKLIVGTRRNRKTTASLDIIDSSKEYTKENCQ